MVAIIQARLGSTRFPKKIFTDLAGKSLINHCIDNLKSSDLISKVVIATTNNPLDNELFEFCQSKNIFCYRGSEEQVLDRFLQTCKKLGLDNFLRVCSDNPFIDVDLMNEQIKSFENEYDYCSFYTSNNVPMILKPIGMFAEIVSRKALEKSARLGEKDPKTQEHVTFHIHQNPRIFNVKKLTIPKYINPDLRLTVDYPEDIEISESIINNVITLNSFNIIEYINNNRKLKSLINSISFRYPKKY